MSKSNKSPAPQLGDLDKQVTWQRLNTSQPRDAYGQPTRAGRYTDLGTLWVSIKQLGSRAAAYAERLRDTASHAIETLFPGLILETDRFLYVDPHTGANRYFNVTNANDLDQRGFSYLILVTETKNPPESQA